MSNRAHRTTHSKNMFCTLLTICIYPEHEWIDSVSHSKVAQ